MVFGAPSFPLISFKVQYKNNVNAGTAVMIITGKGQYKGKIVNTFNIGKVDLNKKEAAENIQWWSPWALS